MLRDLPKFILIIFIAFFLILTIIYYSINGYRQDSTVQALTETLRSSAIANRDDSARITRGQFKLQKEEFEADFEKLFLANKNLSDEKNEYEFIFEYLEDGKDGVKAIKAKIIDSGNNDLVYQITCVLDVVE